MIQYLEKKFKIKDSDLIENFENQNQSQNLKYFF